VRVTVSRDVPTNSANFLVRDFQVDDDPPCILHAMLSRQLKDSGANPVVRAAVAQLLYLRPDLAQASAQT